LNEHHAYDISGSILYLVMARKAQRSNLNKGITTSGSNGVLYEPHGVAIGADGKYLYIADTRSQRVRHMGTNGIIIQWQVLVVMAIAVMVGPATEAKLLFSEGVAIGADDESNLHS